MHIPERNKLEGKVCYLFIFCPPGDLIGKNCIVKTHPRSLPPPYLRIEEHVELWYTTLKEKINIFGYTCRSAHTYIKINKYVSSRLGEGNQNTHNGICFPVGLCIFSCLNAVLWSLHNLWNTSAYFTLADEHNHFFVIPISFPVRCGLRAQQSLESEVTLGTSSLFYMQMALHLGSRAGLPTV